MGTSTALLTPGKASPFKGDSYNEGSSVAEKMKHLFAANKRHGVTVLMADDDFDDCLLARDAWDELRTDHILRFVHDGQEVLDYLHHQGQHRDHQASPSPALILLDLNIPKKNGMEVLSMLKCDPQLRVIPVIAFTTNKNIDHILQTYQDGANAFMSKPTSFEGYVNVLKAVELFWLTLAELPTI